jgi:hypothetical protein
MLSDLAIDFSVGWLLLIRIFFHQGGSQFFTDIFVDGQYGNAKTKVDIPSK